MFQQLTPAGAAAAAAASNDDVLIVLLFHCSRQVDRRHRIDDAPMVATTSVGYYSE